MKSIRDLQQFHYIAGTVPFGSNIYVIIDYLPIEKSKPNLLIVVSSVN